MLLRGAIAFAVLSAGFGGRARACKCDYPQDIEEARDRADLVFQGRPVDRVATAGMYGAEIPGWTYLFVVEKQWKGQPRAVQRVSSSYSSCGRSFERNVSYLIFASSRGDLETTERCDVPFSLARPVAPGDPAVAALGRPSYDAAARGLELGRGGFVEARWPDGPPVVSAAPLHRHWHPLLFLVAAVLLAYPAIRDAYAQPEEDNRRQRPPPPA
jgi:hypothetical protein